MKGLAEQLRTRRESKGLSQRHLADLMGVHENTVFKLERNPERALLETIEKAAYALDINIGNLFFGATLQCGKQLQARDMLQGRQGNTQ
jgi:transcriptional regulator with XRE-family HTH domain